MAESAFYFEKRMIDPEIKEVYDLLGTLLSAGKKASFIEQGGRSSRWWINWQPVFSC
jgi:hypothetical protein